MKKNTINCYNNNKKSKNLKKIDSNKNTHIQVMYVVKAKMICLGVSIGGIKMELAT